MAFSHERDIGHFDRWAPSYDRGWAQRIFFRPLYRRALAVVETLAPDPEHILDVGCGTGGFLRLAAARVPAARLTGVDPSEAMVAQAVAANPAGGRLTFVRAAAEALPFPDGTFDLALSTMSFHHWADQAKGLVEIGRVLRPGATLLLADHFVIRSHSLLYAMSGTRERFHRPARIDQMLAAAGFEACAWRMLYRIGPFPIVAAVTARQRAAR